MKTAALDKIAGRASLFRRLVSTLRPIVSAAKARGSFLPGEARQLSTGVEQFLGQRMGRRNLPVQFQANPAAGHVGGTVQTPKGPLEFRNRFPLQGEQTMPWLDVEHTLYAGGRGSGVGSRMMQNLNRFYQALGFDATRTHASYGAQSLWGRPRFGNQATLKGIKSMRPYSPAQLSSFASDDSPTFFRVFNPQMRANLSAGKPVMEGLKQGSLIGEVKRRASAHVD